MPRLVAALDADVLVPILCCDFLLTAFDLGLYEPVVSTDALAVVERNLIEDFPHLDPAAVRRRVGQMREALDAQLIEPGSVDDGSPIINPKDRHVIAAALASEVATARSRCRSIATSSTSRSMSPRWSPRNSPLRRPANAASSTAARIDEMARDAEKLGLYD